MLAGTLKLTCWYAPYCQLLCWTGTEANKEKKYEQGQGQGQGYDTSSGYGAGSGTGIDGSSRSHTPGTVPICSTYADQGFILYELGYVLCCKKILKCCRLSGQCGSTERLYIDTVATTVWLSGSCSAGTQGQGHGSSGGYGSQSGSGGLASKIPGMPAPSFSFWLHTMRAGTDVQVGACIAAS